MKKSLPLLLGVACLGLVGYNNNEQTAPTWDEATQERIR